MQTSEVDGLIKLTKEVCC